jgi:hypothetical protein
MAQKLVFLLVASVALMSVLVSAGPTLVALANAAVPLVIAIGIVVGVLRLVFLHTRKW